jgi:hypothetical protein
MGGTLRGASSGAIIGITAVLLGQQLGFVDLGPTIGAAYLAIGGIVGAVVFGLIGRRLGGKSPRDGVQPWNSSTDPTPTKTASDSSNSTT